MADFITCANRIDIQTVLKSLFGLQNDGQFTVLRVAIYDGTALDAACGIPYMSLEEALPFCISIGSDGLPVLRLGRVPVNSLNCDYPEDPKSLMERCICATQDGVAIAIYDDNYLN